jgi:hypothetical protein
MLGQRDCLAAAMVAGCALCGCQARQAAPTASSFVPAHSSRAESADFSTSEETPSIVHATNHEAVASSSTEVEGSSRWSKLFGGFGKPKPIPLPRTDLDSGEGFGPSAQSEPSVASEF